MKKPSQPRGQIASNQDLEILRQANAHLDPRIDFHRDIERLKAIHPGKTEFTMQDILSLPCEVCGKVSKKILN